MIIQISESLATEVEFRRNELATQMEEREDAREILRRVVEGVFPFGLEDAVATHVTGTERGVIVQLAACLLVAVEEGITE